MSIENGSPPSPTFIVQVPTLAAINENNNNNTNNDNDDNDINERQQYLTKVFGMLSIQLGFVISILMVGSLVFHIAKLSNVLITSMITLIICLIVVFLSYYSSVTLVIDKTKTIL